MNTPDWLKQLMSSLLSPLSPEWFLKFYLMSPQRDALIRTNDPVRYGTVLLAMEQIKKEQIPGTLAEGGVYKGRMSRFVHDLLPDRKLILFDTFQGFDARDSGSNSDHRFKDSSEEEVLAHLGNIQNVLIRKGFFPETAQGLEDERFAFVMIDFDRYEPTLAALEFFYPRTNPGGFIFVHDYSSPESNWACSRALNSFLSDKAEKPMLIPDKCGSAMFRKI